MATVTRYATKVAQRARVMEIHQNQTGRWSALVECPDGIVRRFSCRNVEPVVQRFTRPVRRPVRTRFDVFQRDGFTCRYCGRRPPEAVLHVDHIVAVADGGTNEPGNLLTACSDCNEGKGARHSGGVLDDRPDLHRTAMEIARDALGRIG